MNTDETMIRSNIKAAFVRGGAKAVIDHCSGSNHCTETRAWALAMTSHYGPVGLHQDWTGVDGRPDWAKLAEYPRTLESVKGSVDAATEALVRLMR